ncbi:MAG: hypothetical protein ACI9MC_003483 [Kiritimatiellia bacterium]|jgi:hypothetical protein
MRLLTLALGLAACQLTAPDSVAPDSVAPDRALTEADKPFDCASGCDKDGHDYIGTLASEDYRSLRDELAKLPVDADSDAFDSLLYYGEQTSTWLQAEPGDLSKDHLDRLNHELSRTQAVVQMRLVGDDGTPWAQLLETEVPLGDKQHLALDVQNVQAIETSGTVVRTTKDHLWARF